jgi:alkylhydroperoxidase family enzyme
MGHIATFTDGASFQSTELIATLFWSGTAIAFRARLLEVCGQRLSQTTEPASDIVARFQALLGLARNRAAAGKTEPQELSSMGWWASSLIIPADCPVARLQRLLHLGGVPEPAHVVAERLVELTPTHVADTVQCVSFARRRGHRQMVHR